MFLLLQNPGVPRYHGFQNTARAVSLTVGIGQYPRWGDNLQGCVTLERSGTLGIGVFTSCSLGQGFGYAAACRCLIDNTVYNIARP